jgi:peroxiredoxin
MPAAVGEMAPAFTLYDTERKPRSLSEFLGKKTILAFYPGAFTGVCTKEMCTFRDSIPAFDHLGAHVVGISVDAPAANKAFAEQNRLTFPILNDFAREVIGMYGVVQQDFGVPGLTTAKRSVFILDGSGIIKYVWVAPNPGVEPNYDDITHALSSF